MLIKQNTIVCTPELARKLVFIRSPYATMLETASSRQKVHVKDKTQIDIGTYKKSGQAFSYEGE